MDEKIFFVTLFKLLVYKKANEADFSIWTRCRLGEGKWS